MLVGSAAGISDGFIKRIRDALPGTLKSKLVHYLPDQVFVGPQERIGLNPAGKAH